MDVDQADIPTKPCPDCEGTGLNEEGRKTPPEYRVDQMACTTCGGSGEVRA
jgi:DnaJ-class molecular chaperone